MLNRKIFFAFIFLLTVNESTAQVGSISNYSRFGLGALNESSFASSQIMGGVSSVWADPYTVNPENPASYSFNYRTTFQVDGTGQFLSSTANDQTENFNNAGLNGLVLLFKRDGGRAAYTLGLKQFSSSGYNSSSNETLENIGNVTYNYEGSGGVNKAHLGFSYRAIHKKGVGGLLQGNDTVNYELLSDEEIKDLGKKFNTKHRVSFGLNTEYYFGEINRIKYTQFEDLSYFNTRNTSSTFIRDLNLTFGAMGQFNLIERFESDIFKKRLDVLVGATYTLGKDMNTTFGDLTENTVGTNFVEVLDTVGMPLETDGTLYFPSRIGLGAGFKYTTANKSELYIMLDYKNQDWSSFETSQDGSNSGIESYQNANELSLGVVYKPSSKESKSSLIGGVDLRAGVRTGQTYIKVNDQSISESAVSFGFSIPLKGSSSFSRIILGTEFGLRGTDDNNLVRENFTNINVGLSFSPYGFYPWFVKQKYN